MLLLCFEPLQVPGPSMITLSPVLTAVNCWCCLFAGIRRSVANTQLVRDGINALDDRIVGGDRLISTVSTEAGPDPEPATGTQISESSSRLRV